MKTIGLIGGMSWESSVVYYQLLNRGINQRLGGLHSCKSVLYTVDFEEVSSLQREGNWDQLAEMMVTAAQSLEKAGADMVLICANTMHKVAEQVEHAVSIPLVHIGDATARAVTKKGFKKVALLGTRYTMEQDFLKRRIQTHGIELLIPEDEQRSVVHEVIYTELVKGIIIAESRSKYLEIISELVARGAEGIILGCTEIGLLITPKDTDAILFDTTVIHAEKAIELALGL